MVVELISGDGADQYGWVFDTRWSGVCCQLSGLKERKLVVRTSFHCELHEWVLDIKVAEEDVWIIIIRVSDDKCVVDYSVLADRVDG